MKRVMTEVRTFNVRLYCDCGGEIIANGNVIDTHPPVYAHQCDKCTSVTTYEQAYPTTETVEVGEPQEVPFE